MKRFLFLACIIFVCWSCALAPSCEGGSCTRVLFIGNSYTFANDLPGTFAKLANAGGHAVQVDMLATGGAKLADYVSSQALLQKLTAAQWNYVILQEQSEIPSMEASRVGSMYPAARWLAGQIRQVGGTPVFLVTWAHRDGWPENGLRNYEAMQHEIDQGYLRIARELNAPLAPVGYAWFQARQQNPDLELWQSDGSHPAMAGTYLAGCVLYAALFSEKPDGLNYTGGLPSETAHSLQVVAADTVLTSPAQWNLP